MKKIFIFHIPILFFLFIFIQNIFADEIHLQSGITIKGTILRVTPGYVEYDPEGNRPFDMVSRDQVIEIVYEDGEVVKLNESKPSDEKSDTQTVAEPGKKPEEINSDEKTVTETEPGEKSKKDQPLKAKDLGFVEFELGWNGYVGLGVRIDFTIFNSFSINGGVGVGLWGYRISAGARYYFIDCTHGPVLGLGIAYNTGQKGTELDGTVQDSAGYTYKDTLVFNCKPVAVVNLTLLYGFQLSSNNKIYIEAGYGIRLSDDNYTYKAKNTAGEVRLDNSTKDAIDVMQPGGVIISMGFALAI